MRPLLRAKSSLRRAAVAVSPRGRSPLRRAAVPALTIAVLAAILASGGPGGGAPGARAAASAQPNIVVITTDDQRLTLNRRVMPETKRRIVDKGTRFTQAIVTTPLCCPSRASMLTGQYAHNHGTLSNRAGYPALVDKENVLPEWLRQAGYRTAHVGKFLNGYPGGGLAPQTVAPGWDEWATLMIPRLYYNFDLSINGTPTHYGKRDRDHLTRTLTRQAVQVIRRNAGEAAPFFLQLDHFAPHTEPQKSRSGRCGGNVVPEARDLGLFKDEPVERPPSYNEDDVSDKPSFVQELAPLNRKRRDALKQRNRCRLAALHSVDRSIAKVMRTLKQEGELSETVIVFISDNGYFLGEHRIKVNKTLPYEEALRVPLAIRAPRAYRGNAEQLPKSDEPVANIDLVPTLLDWAGADPCRSSGDCRTMDGRSLVGLLSGENAGWPDERALLVEYGRAVEGDNILGVCGYQGLRLPETLYIEYTSLRSASRVCEPSRERELYDLDADPHQLANLFPPAPATPEAQKLGELEARLSSLQDCSGIAGRDPDPEGRRTHCE